VSADTMPCGCEGHADNEGLCRFPALEQEVTRLKSKLKHMEVVNLHIHRLYNLRNSSNELIAAHIEKLAKTEGYREEKP
jgi:hypothetical protein